MDRSYRIYPHQQNGKFFNYPHEKKESVFFRSCAMYFKGRHIRNSGLDELAAWHKDGELNSVLRQAQDETVKKTIFNVNQLDNLTNQFFSPSNPERQSKDSVSEVEGSNPRITWIGHSTFLIQFPTYNILTDPVFNDLTLLFKRIQNPGIAREQLPRIDAVIISHNHRDHMEQETLQYLAQQFPACTFFVPQGDKYWFDRWKIDNVIELSWWDARTVKTESKTDQELRLMFLPAHHWSQRSLFDYNRSLWGSWMIEHGDVRLYFAGDTAYAQHFEAIAKEFTGIDCALMPIGPCEPNQWMKSSHMNAEEAGRGFLELGARTFIPMHWGTFKFGLDRPMLPLERIMHWWEQECVGKNNLNVELLPLKLGRTISLPNITTNTVIASSETSSTMVL